MKSRVDIKAQAKDNFYSQYWTGVLMFAVYSLVTSALSGATAGIGALLLMPPITVGYAYFSLRVYNGETGDIVEAVSAGFQDYGRSVVGILWMYLFTFLWSLLLIIPGIIKGLAYSMTPYILADEDMKGVSAKDALKLSMKMTEGYLGEIFVMILSFIGWWILSVLTLGILAVFFTGPYTATSMAGLYEELKNRSV